MKPQARVLLRVIHPTRLPAIALGDESGEHVCRSGQGCIQPADEDLYSSSPRGVFAPGPQVRLTPSTQITRSPGVSAGWPRLKRRPERYEEAVGEREGHARGDWR